MERHFAEHAYKRLRGLFVWSFETPLRSVLTIITFFIVLPPIIEFFQSLLTFSLIKFIVDYIAQFFLKNFSVPDYILLIFSITSLGSIYIINKMLRATKRIVENFDNGLNAWSVPLYSEWATINCDDAPGKMLSVTNSKLPGTLKPAYIWYDYVLNLRTKIDEKIENVEDKRFGIIVRAENNNNGVLLEFTQSNFRPYLLHESKLYLDDTKVEKLPTILNAGEWIYLKITVLGSDIDIKINDYSLRYRIPVHNLSVESNLTYTFDTVSDLLASDKRIDEEVDAWVKAWDKMNKEKDPEKKKELSKAVDDIKVPNSEKIILDYQKGSIGIHTRGKARAYFKDIILLKL